VIPVRGCIWYAALVLTVVVLMLGCIIVNASASTNYVTRGDEILISESQPEGTCWFFPITGPGVYDQPAVTINGSTFCKLSKEQTQDLTPMQYTLVYEIPVKANGKYFKDVSWVNDTLVSAFSSVHSIDESGKHGAAIMTDMEKIVAHNGFNTLASDTVTIQEPDIKIAELYRWGEFFYILSGTSNMADGTPVTINIDEDRYFAQHNSSFTFSTVIKRSDYESTGTWAKEMLLSVQDMPVGWHTVTVYSRELVTTSQFRVNEREWDSAPRPPEHVKYLNDGDIAPVTVTVTVPVIKTEIIDHWYTATPTPDITDALGSKIAYPYKPGDTIPFHVGIIGLLAIAAIVLMRDRKWGK